MNCNLSSVRKSVRPSLVTAGLTVPSITGFGLAVALLGLGFAPAFGQSPPGALYQVGVLPPEPKPVIPPGDDIIIYIHGGPGSKLEEASDLVNPLIQEGLKKGKRYTVISFDQVSQGYSSMVEPNAFLPPPPGAQSRVTSFPITGEQRDHFDGIDAYMDTTVTINRNSDGSGALRADTHTWSMSNWVGFHGAVAVALLDVAGGTLWVSSTQTYGVNAKKGRRDTFTDAVPAEKLLQANYLAIVQKYNPKTAFNDINQWLRTVNNLLQELAQCLKDIPKTVGIVPDDKIDEYYPLAAFSEQSIIAFVNELDKIVPVKNRNIYFIGGSTGGALALRMGHRQEPWIKKIVAWNPASVWTTYTHDVLKTKTALDTGFSRAKEEEDPINSRPGYFKGVFGTPLTGLPESIVDLQPNPEEWYRGDRGRYASSGDTQKPFRTEWPCKWDYIGETRLEQEEVYNQVGRRWHYRLGSEMLTFSFFNDSWAGPANTASQNGGKPANYLGINKPTLLVASDDDDWNEGWIPPGSGAVIGFSNPAPIYFHWEDRWTQVHAMAPLMRNTPGYTLYVPDTGHSIHNERPNFFAAQIVSFLSSPGPATGPLQVGPLFDESKMKMTIETNCQPQQVLPASEYPLPDAALLDAPTLQAARDAVQNLRQPARLGGHFSDGKDPGQYSLRLRPELRAAARAVPQAKLHGQDPTGALANTLGAAAARYYVGDVVWGNALADLAVTGREAYNALRLRQPTDAQISAAVHSFVPSAAGVQLTGAITAAQTRAYKVAWALRNPDPEAAFKLRKDPSLGWIAVSGEDDAPARPVNVPSGIPIYLGPNGKPVQVSAYPQYEIPVTMCPTKSPPYVPYECDPQTQGSVTFQIRYTIATLDGTRPGSVVSAGGGPIITGVSPAGGPITGGTLVHVSLAQGSASNASVTFGGAIPPQARCDSENCWFSTPPNSKPGPVDIIVAAQGASALVPRVSSKPSPFTYTPNAELAGFGPDATTTDPAAYIVSLDGIAPAGGATVELRSNNPSVVAVPQAVTIRGVAVPVPLTILPVPKDETVTLTATYEGKLVSVVVSAPAWPPIRIDPASGNARFTLDANVTITLPTLAPPGGTAVALRWSDPTAFLPPLPTSVIIPAGRYSTTFKIVATTPSVRNGVPVFKQITLTATVGGKPLTPAPTPMSVPFGVPPSRPPGGPNGTRQY